MTKPSLVGYRIDWTPITLDGVQVAEGQAVYELLLPSGSSLELRQPFARGAGTQYSGRLLVWGWDGDPARPTLSPSYLARFPWGDLEGLVVVHLYLRAGQIELLSDSTVELTLESL